MRKYLLDTNAVIVYLNGRSERLRQHLQSLDRDRIYVCSVVKAELYYGAMRTQHPEVTLQKQNQFLDGFVSLAFDDKAAKYYGQIRATLAAQGTPIGPNDFLIASIAVANQLILVTHNTQEFSRIEGLWLEDWEA